MKFQLHYQDPYLIRQNHPYSFESWTVGELPKANSAFQKAVDLESLNPSLYYNYGLLLQEQSNLLKAESILLLGFTLNPQAVNINYALTVFYLQQNKPEVARKYGENLKNLDPQNPDFQLLFQNLEI